MIRVRMESFTYRQEPDPTRYSSPVEENRITEFEMTVKDDLADRARLLRAFALALDITIDPELVIVPKS